MNSPNEKQTGIAVIFFVVLLALLVMAIA
jgi:hypothetical protein